MSAGKQKARSVISVPQIVYDELVEMQQAFEAEHPGASISLWEMAKRLLAAQPVQP